MSIINTVTAFAAVAVGTEDPEIEARIAPRAARLTMARLAGKEIYLGFRAVIGAVKIAAVKQMRHLVRTVSMAGSAVESGGETTGH